MLVLVAVAHAEGPLKFAGGPECFQTRAGLSLNYSTAEEIDAYERASAAAELRDPKLGQAPGGLFFVMVGHPDISVAAPERYLLVVKDATGAEVLRFKPEHAVPDMPDDRGYWHSSFVAPIAQAVKFYPLSAYVVDTVDTKRCAWSVIPDAVVAKPEEEPPK